MRTILITGATDGIGLETARQLARQGHEIVLHGRSEERAHHVRDLLLRAMPVASIHTVSADFADLAEVARMARAVSSRFPCLDVLVNNAGVYLTSRMLSRNGYEMTLAVNHLAHFLLTLSLLPLLKRSTEARVVTVSSMVHSGGHIQFEDMNGGHRFDGYAAYANSKLANVLFANELARREPWLASNSLHPGVIDTKLLHAAFSMAGAPVQEGARTSVYLAVSPEVAGITGKYFTRSAEAEASARAQDPALATELWAWSENATKNWFRSNLGSMYN